MKVGQIWVKFSSEYKLSSTRLIYFVSDFWIINDFEKEELIVLKEKRDYQEVKSIWPA